MSPFDLRIDVGHPLVRGPLALYPLFGDGPQSPAYLPGPVAAAAGSLQVGERPAGPAVPELSVTNTGTQPVLLIDGESFVGGWQNRTFNVTALVAAGSTVAVPVSCVEQGRWGGAPEGARRGAMAPAALRARSHRGVAAGVLGGSKSRRADQGDVWSAVREYSDRFEVHAPTGALADVQQARQGEVMSMVAGTSALSGQRGVAVAVGGRVTSIDLFDRDATMAAYWDSLVRAYALDAVGLSGDAVPPGRKAVLEAFETLRVARTRTVAGVGLGHEIHATGPGVTAGALVWDYVCVHLAVHCAA